MNSSLSTPERQPERIKSLGPYTFEQFKDLAGSFHGYPAPGLLIGGVMVSLARSRVQPDTLFDALVETSKCLPDAVQLLTPCSTGNGWMKVLDLGRYAVTLYDKYTGQGWRAHIHVDRLAAWPGIRAWFLKLEPKQSQDTIRLFQEIQQAGWDYMALQPVRVRKTWLGKAPSGAVAVCPACGEAYPERHGSLCRACAEGEPFVRIRTP